MTQFTDSAAGSAALPSNPVVVAYYHARELAAFKGGFLARTAHELRSPLNKVISLQQMILEGLCNDVEEKWEFVAEAQAAALKLLEYLDFLIRVSKIETGGLTPQMQAVDLADSLRQVADMTHLQARDRGLQLYIEPPSVPLQVWADPAWLNNSLITLVDMAIDGCDRGTIHLHLAPSTGESPQPAVCHLWLEGDHLNTPWQETLQLPALADFELDDTLSDSLRLALVEALLAAMGGSLMLVAPPNAPANQMCLQVTLPLSPRP